MAKDDHPRRRFPRGPLDLIRLQRGGDWPLTQSGMRRRRYGRIAGWPIDILWWVQTVQPSKLAVELEPGLWIELQIVSPAAPPQIPQAEAAAGDRDDSGPADFPRVLSAAHTQYRR